MICVLVSHHPPHSSTHPSQAYLNGIDLPDVLSTRTLFSKVAAVTGSVASGLAVGKEGPFVHIGACIGALLSRAMSWVLRRFYSLNLLATDWEVQDFVICGASAGVSAAFRAPVGA